MCTTLYVSILVTSNIIHVNCQDDDYTFFETTTIGLLAEGERKLSESIRVALEHFKQPNFEGFPGLNMSDPYFVPDMRQSLGFGTNLVFTDTALHGISKFRILYINADIEDMESHAVLVLDKLEISGKYSLNMWLSSYKGTFTAYVSNIKATAIATLGIERDGKLKAQNISIDITVQNIVVHFENAGLLATLISGVFNSLSTFLFDSIKPILLSDAHTNIRQEINKKLDDIVGDIKFPNTISPIDMIIIDTRNKIRELKMDPFKVDDYIDTTNFLKIILTNTWITGLSSLYRIGNISLYIENGTVVADFSIGTQELKGSTQWEINGFGGFMYKAGISSFSVKYIRGRFLLVQPLDTRQRLEFRDLRLELGNIQASFNGAGTLDYIFELSANILPTLLRYQIIETIQNPIKWKIQQELNEINIEDMIINKLPIIDKIQEDGFQLSALRTSITDEMYEDDEFFNF